MQSAGIDLLKQPDVAAALHKKRSLSSTAARLEAQNAAMTHFHTVRGMCEEPFVIEGQLILSAEKYQPIRSAAFTYSVLKRVSSSVLAVFHFTRYMRDEKAGRGDG